jgi:hypothetical protein
MDNRAGYTSALFTTSERLYRKWESAQYSLAATRRVMRVILAIILQFFNS